MAEAYQQLAVKHNSLGLTKKMPETVTAFYDRPFKVIGGSQFAQELVSAITDPAVKQLATKLRLIGNIDQWSDSVDITGLDRLKLRQLYEI